MQFNKNDYPFFEQHITYLKVQSRKRTGVGIYINFDYYINHDLKFNSSIKHLSLSSDKLLEEDSLKYDINYELNITNGRFDFLELVTNGEVSGGNYKNYKFIGC
jgi:hypothetical protein